MPDNDTNPQRRRLGRIVSICIVAAACDHGSFGDQAAPTSTHARMMRRYLPILSASLHR